jgi:hypothetical protein
MSGTQKKPTGTTGFTAMTLPVGLNKVVNGIGTALHTALNASNVKCQVFGLCEPRTHADGRRWPSMYNSTLAGDEFNLLPSDQWPSYLFFDREDPITYEYETGRQGSVKKATHARTKVALIFYGNLKWYGLSTRLGEDYRITKEEIRNTILRTLWQNCTNIGGEITPTSVYDLNISDVFKGFALNDTERQYFAQPFYGLRIEMDVFYREPCGTGVGSFYFSYIPTSLAFPLAAGSQDIVITSNTSWTATDDAGWLTVTASGSGNSTLTVTATLNTGAERSGTVTITPAGWPAITIPVTQLLNPFYVTPVLYNTSYHDKTLTSTIASATTWTAVSDSAWAVPTAAGSNNDPIDIVIEHNYDPPRTAIITITPVGGSPVTITINQASE